MTEPVLPPPAPSCYRHAGRETYIACARCGRPICPDCMTSAPVGFQCPECIAEGSATVRRPTTVAGAPVGIRPTVTYTLVGLCLAVFGYEFVAGVDAVSRVWGMFPPSIALEGEFYRLLSSVFLHGSVLHLGFNMLLLWVLGGQLETLLGHTRFLVLYLLSGLGGAVASFMLSAPLTLSVGASGAIFGLMGAIVVAGRRYRIDIRQALLLIGINVVIGFAPGAGIDWRAHLGGLATGAVVGVILVYSPRQNRVLWQALGCLGVLGALVILTMWRTAQLHALFDATVVGA